MREGWTYKRLGEVCEVVSGSTPKTNIPEYWGEGHYWVTPAELNDSTVYVNKTDRQITDAALAKTNLQLLPVGTVLLSSRAPIGKVAITNAEMYCNQGFKNCICSDAIYNKYLFYYFKFKNDYLNSLGRGATFKEISKTIVESIIIPLPPFNIQQSIVAELDKINELIGLKKSQLNDLDCLAQSIFYEMFGDPVENEKGWEVKKLKDSCIKISDGPFGSNLKSEHYVESGIRVIRLQNIGVREFVDKDKAYISLEHYNELKKYSCYPNDVVIGTMGEPNLRACKVPQNIDTSIHKADCVHIVPNENVALAEFFVGLLNTPSFVKAKSNAVHGQTRGRISYGQIKEFIIPLPPLPLQQSFAARISAIEQQKQWIRASIKDLETLLALRMQHWFDG